MVLQLAGFQLTFTGRFWCPPRPTAVDWPEPIAPLVCAVLVLPSGTACGSFSGVNTAGSVFFHYHHDEEDTASVPSAHPAYASIINIIAERHRFAKPKELGLIVHGNSRPDTSMALLPITVNSALANL